MTDQQKQNGSRAKPARRLRVLAPGPPLRNLTKESGKSKTLCQISRCATNPQRVRHSRFFGASPVASALDLRAGRDPGANRFTVACLSLPWL